MERNYQELTEADLVASIRNGDYNAFTEVYNRFSPLLYNCARKFLKDISLTEDVLQDVFIIIWERRGKLEIKTSLRNYLFEITKNACLKNIKKTNQIEGYLNSLQKEIDRIEPTTEDYILKKELNKILEAEIELLPENMKRVLKLSRTGELSYREISEQLSMAEGTIRNHVSGATKELKFKLHKLFSIFF